jgi:dTDP-4-amino-4,6-dideoxygalactose transaminase
MVVYEKGKPIFIDSEYETWNMDPKALEKAFELYPETKVVVIVHLYGVPAKLDEIKEICDKHGAILIEDAAESLGATYKGKQTGTIGEIGVFSFNGNKIITTSGGGMMVSNNEEYTKKALFLATQAREPERHYEHKEIGYNYRMSNVVAGIGRGQLRVLDNRISKKKEIYERYKKELSNIKEIKMQPIRDYGEPNYWLSVITLDKKSKIKPLDIILALEKENIESRPVWKPIHIQPYYEGYKFFYHGDEEEISVAEDIFNRGVCLPSDTKMTMKDQKRVISIIKDLFD